MINLFSSNYKSFSKKNLEFVIVIIDKSFAKIQYQISRKNVKNIT